MMAVVLIVNYPLVFSSKLQRHLLLRTGQPFCDRDLPRPVVFFSILSKGKSTTVGSRTAVTKFARAVKIASIRPTTKGSAWTGYWSSSRGIPWVLVVNITYPILSLASEVVLLHMLRQSRLSRDVSLTCVPILLTVVCPSIMEV